MTHYRIVGILAVALHHQGVVILIVGNRKAKVEVEVVSLEMMEPGFLARLLSVCLNTDGYWHGFWRIVTGASVAGERGSFIPSELRASVLKPNL